jgi:hypothetical protein
MASTDNDRHQNGSGGRKGQKRRSKDTGSDDEDLPTSKGSASKKSRRVIDDGDDSDGGEAEFGMDDDSDPSDSLKKKTPTTKIKTIARKKDDGGKQDVTPRSSSPITTRLIANIRKRVDPKRSSPSDVRSTRPSQDPSKAPEDGTIKVPKKSKAPASSQEAPKSLLANLAKRSPIDDPKVNPRPASRPQSRPYSKPQTKSEQPKDNINSETTRRPPPNGRPTTAPAVAEGANKLSSAASAAPPAQPDVTAKPAQQSEKPTRSRVYKMVESLVVKNLQELVAATKLTLPPNQTRQRIDLAGSFFPEDEAQNFFETNDAGEIVLPPRKPIFPEEFPSGMKEQDLAWWGIADQRQQDEPKKPAADAT